MRKYFSVLLLMFIFQYSFSQEFKSEKRIYLLDVTASMGGVGWGTSGNIFPAVKEKLKKSIHQIKKKDTEITIIPFTSTPLPKKSFLLDSISAIDKYIDNLVIRRGNTNIADAWSAALQEIDESKVNYLFLLTDGFHNTGVSKSVLFNYINDWPVFSEGKDYFAFYVTLTENEIENEFVSLIDGLKQFWAVKSMDINILFITTKNNQTIDLSQSPRAEIEQYFSIEPENKFQYTIEIEDNPYYCIKDISINTSKKYSISFRIIEKNSEIEIPNETNIKLDIVYNQNENPFVFLNNNQIITKIKNSKDIKDKENYSSCLFWIILILLLISLTLYVFNHYTFSGKPIKEIFNIKSHPINNIKDKNEEDNKDESRKIFRVPYLAGRRYWISETEPQGIYIYKEFKIHNHRVWGIFPDFEGDCVKLDKYYMEDSFWRLKGSKYKKQMEKASLLLYEQIQKSPQLQMKYTTQQKEELKAGKAEITGYTWHHKEDWLVMQLVNKEEHKKWKHTGGSYVWNEKKFKNKYGKEWDKYHL